MIPLIANFTLRAGIPVDDRMVVFDVTERDNLAWRYNGMTVYIDSTNEEFILLKGLVDSNLNNNANWKLKKNYYGLDNVYTKAEIDTKFANETLDTVVARGYITTRSIQIGGLTVNGNTTINGDLIVNGTQTIVNSTVVEVKDNIMTLNAGEVGAGVTAGQSGIQIDRGSATDYLFVFDEFTDTFRIGITGQLQAVATRKDTMLNNGVVIWDGVNNTLDTIDRTVFDGNYIQNRTTLQTSSNFFISGKGKVGGTNSALQQFEVVGTDTAPAASGTAQNGAVRIFGIGVVNTMLDIGVAGTLGYSWIQSRDSGAYVTNRELRLNPNGGNIIIGNGAVQIPSLPTNATTDFNITIDASGNLRKSSATISGSYILNQLAAVQTGNFFISGQGKFGGTGLPIQKVDIIGTDAAPLATGGSTANGSIRLGEPSGSAVNLEMGVAGTLGYSWIQCRLGNDYTSQRELRINPNGGRVIISAGGSAVTGLAAAVNINPFLTATANNDSLVGLDINPNFTTGAFTNVLSYALRIQNRGGGAQILLGTTNQAGTIDFARGTDGAVHGNIGYLTATTGTDFGVRVTGGSSVAFLDGQAFSDLRTNGVTGVKLSSTNNLIIQNGGTFTDAGFRLDVQGTARIVGLDAAASLSGSAANGALRIGTISSSAVIVDNGISIAGDYAWMQARNGSDYSIQKQYRINPNGGQVLVGSGLNTTSNQFLTVSTLYTALNSAAILELKNLAPLTANQTIAQAVQNGVAGGGADAIYYIRHNNYDSAGGFVDGMRIVMNGLSSSTIINGLTALNFNIGTAQGVTKVHITSTGAFVFDTATVQALALPTNATTDLPLTIDASGNIRKGTASVTGSYILNQNGSVQTSAKFNVTGPSVVQDGSSNYTAIQQFSVYGTDADSGVTGAIRNGGFRVGHGNTLDTLMDFGSKGKGVETVQYSWIQSRSGSDYSVNKLLSINPNGGIVTIGGGTQNNNTTDRFQVNGSAWINGGAEALKVGTNTGNPDHAYIGLYARTATPTTQSGYIGYNGVGAVNLSLVNNLNNGVVVITSTGATSTVQVNTSQFQILPTGSAVQGWVQAQGLNNANTENALVINSALGTITNGSKVIVRSSGTTLNQPTLNTNILGQYVFSGWRTAGTIYDSGSIRGLATEAWSATAGGSLLDFYITPNTTIAQFKALRLDQDGSLVHYGNRTGTAVNALGVDSTGKLVNISGGNTKTGTSVQNGSASLTYTITHGASFTPTGIVLTQNSIDASGFTYVTVGATTITITYPTGRTVGTNNLTWSYIIF